jgi:DNA-binding NtrC family response regulator
MTHVLLVDDETAFLDSAARALRLQGGIETHLASRAAEALAILEAAPIEVAFLDVTMPEMSGLDLLARVVEGWPAVACVMVTARDDVKTVMRATKLGAIDYLVKPIVPDQLLHALARASEHRRMSELVQLARDDESLSVPSAFSAILTCDTRTLRLLREAELHARSHIPVLVLGETGTGKELLARAIHDASPRREGPFVAVNMLSLASSLFESEFFGHTKGAFTGALADREGYLHRARGGTLFLDEIGDLPPELQGKLLRILQEGEFTPVGATSAQKADVRFVAATHRDLDALVREGRFRRDLLYRLRFAQLSIPPLRERTDDLLLLAATFARQSIRPGVKLSETAVAALTKHHWPGNVRELKGVIEAAANLAEHGEILPRHMQGLPHHDAAAETQVVPLAEIERRHIIAVYRELGENKTGAARALGISVPTLVRKLRAYGAE